jgi:ATP-binding cassette subfamily B protein
MAHDRRLAGMLSNLAADPNAAGELRVYGLTDQIAAQHSALIETINKRSKAEAVKVLFIQGIGWLICATLLMGAIAFVVVRASDGAITLGTVLMTVSLIRRSRNQLSSTASNSAALLATLTTADRLFWLEDHAADQAREAGTQEAPAALRTGIELRGVTFRYPGTERAVLDEFDLVLPAGATVAVVGENGSGKTTLAKLLLGMYPPDGGEILVDGTALSAIDPERWRERCTAAFQDFSRLHLPAVESVGVADLPRLDDRDGAQSALDRAGAADPVSSSMVMLAVSSR